MTKKNPQGPKRKRMQRQSRLQAAKHWIPSYTGKNIIKGYQNWFGVDLCCAIHELKLLDVKVDEHFVNQALKSREQRIAMRQKKKCAVEVEDFSLDSDENFYFIVGYTRGGFPYGTTWEEAAEQELEDPV